MPDNPATPPPGDRLAKVIARSGLCSRRDAESWIAAGRVSVNGKKVITPAFNVTERDKITVDGAPLADRQGTRVWLYHKPAGLVVTEKDPEGRPTVFKAVEEKGLPRVVSIGRLDINTEGLLLLTNDGGLKRVLELPSTGWLRRYRVRAHGTVSQAQLDTLKHGMEIEGIKYGPIEAVLERVQGANVWITVALREGKNREVKNVLFALGLEVNRLIRVSFGPFQLGDLPVGAIETVKARVLREQLGKRLAEEADVDFESELPGQGPVVGRPVRERETGRGTNTVEIGQQRFRFADRAEKSIEEVRAERPRVDRPGRFGSGAPAPGRRADAKPDADAPVRRVHFEGGRESEVFQAKTYGKKKPAERSGERPPRGAGGPAGRDGRKPSVGFAERAPREGAPRPRRDAAERPKRAFGDRPARAPRRDDGPAGRPARSADDRPRSDRPKAFPADKPGGNRPRTPRVPRDQDRPDRPRPEARSNGGRPPRPAGGAPGNRAPRPAGARPPGGTRPAGGPRPPRKGGPSAGPRRPRPKA